MDERAAADERTTAPGPTRTGRAPRPAPTYTPGPVTRALRAVSWMLLIAGAVGVAVSYPRMPKSVPVHFNVTGTPDAYGPRSSILWLVIVWAVLQALLAWLSRRPRLFNYPVPVTEDNAQRLYREGERLMVGMMLTLAVSFLGIVVLTATGSGVGHALIVAGLVGMVVGCIVGIVRMTR